MSLVADDMILRIEKTGDSTKTLLKMINLAKSKGYKNHHTMLYEKILQATLATLSQNRWCKFKPGVGIYLYAKNYYTSTHKKKKN